METDFNPYREWFGIAAVEQSPDYYCLLGIPRFESDRAVVASASAKRMALLTPHKDGDRSRAAQKLASEISKATTCLLNPGRKAIYDKHLRLSVSDRSLDESAWPPDRGLGVGPTTESPRTSGIRLGAAGVGTGRLSVRGLRTRVMAISAIVVCGLLLVGSLASWWSRSRSALRTTGPTASTEVDRPEATGSTVAGPKEAELATPQDERARAPVAARLAPPAADMGSAGDVGGALPSKADATSTAAPERPVESMSAGDEATKPTPAVEVAGQALPASPRPGEPGANTAVVAPTKAPQADEPSAPAVSASASPLVNAGATEGMADSNSPAANTVGAVVMRFPAPSAADQEAGRRRIREILDAELSAAKTPEAHAALVDKLLGLARESGNDSVLVYALLEAARDEAIRAGDYARSFQVVEEMERTFAVDADQLKAQTLERAAELARATSDRARIAQQALGLAEEMQREGQFELAQTLAQLAVVQAARARDPELGKAARQRREQITQARRRWNEALAAQVQLSDRPDDPALNLEYGQFLCFQQRAWQDGRTYLAKGANGSLRLAAQQDLLDPTDPLQQLAVANAWFAAADSVDRSHQAAVFERCLYWARRAMPTLKGLEKVNAERRIQEAESRQSALAAAGTGSARGADGKAEPAVPQPPAWQPPDEFRSLVGRIQVEGRDVGVLWKYQAGLPLKNSAIADILRKIGAPPGRLRMELVGLVQVAAPTTVEVAHSGGTRDGGQSAVAIDGRVLGEVGGSHPTQNVYRVDLEPGEHQVQWVLLGGDVGTCGLQFRDKANGLPLAIYHTPVLLGALRGTPFPARLTVEMVQN